MSNRILDALGLYGLMSLGLDHSSMTYISLDEPYDGNAESQICTNCGSRRVRIAKCNQFAYMGKRFYQWMCEDCHIWFSPAEDFGEVCNDHYKSVFENSDRVSSTQLRFEKVMGLDLTRFDSILEIGCGLGDLLHQIRSNYGTLKLAGLDASQQMVDYMKASGLDASSDPTYFTEQFELIIGHHVVEHFEGLQKFEEIIGLLSKSGTIIQLTFPNRANWMQDCGLLPDLHLPMHRFYYQSEDLVTYFQSRNYSILDMSTNETRRLIPNLKQAVYNHLRGNLALFREVYNEIIESIDAIPLARVTELEKEIAMQNLGSECCLLIEVN